MAKTATYYEAPLRALIRELQAEAWDEGWMSGLRDAHDHDPDALPEPNPYRD